MEGIRVHGRGGQGAVVAGELLVVAAFEDNQYGQAFPAFGGERRGAPVEAFIRVDARPIRLRHRVNAPDLIIVLDPSLVRVAGVMRGLHPDGLVVINSDSPPSSLAWTRDASVCCIPATQIALEVLGQPLVNTSMLGAFCAVTGVVSLAAMQKAIHRRFPGRWGEKNSLAAQAGYDWFRQSGAAPVRVVESRAAPTLAPWETSGRLGAPGRPLHFAAVTGPRTALAYTTGSWRYSRPVFDLQRCAGCGLCETYCPDTCIVAEGRKYYADLEYCKGCGICARECPADAIQMVAEEA